MPLELQIIRPSDFIRVDSFGKPDFESSRVTLRELANACRKREIFRAMLDLREIAIPAKPYFTTQELAALVGTFREAGFTKAQRLAILYREDPYFGVHMFTFISHMRGWCVRAFDDFEKALMWISIDEDASSADCGGEDISIRFDGV
jgi:hypothetical protein